MAITSVTLVSAEGGVNESGETTYTAVYRVQSDVGEGPLTARTASGVPSFGDGFSAMGDVDTAALVRSMLLTLPLKVERRIPLRCTFTR